jgi:acetyl esterase/lipase
MIIFATILSGVSLLLSILLIIRLKVINIIFMVRLAVAALTPYWAILGLVGAILGWVVVAPWAVLMGVISTGLVVWFVWRCARDHKGFEKAFGVDWKKQISAEQTKKMVKRRWSFYLKMKASPQPSFERDVVFWTIPDTDRELLCDIWRPADRNISGLALVYIHGGGWVAGEKDYMTRSFFQHLVSQGHTIMDVAYRLCPEVDICGEVGDVKRAVAWMKANASRFGVNPDQVVLGGYSAGAHLALLAGYTPEHLELTPEDLIGTDLSVCGLVSYYAPTDLSAGYEPWMTTNPFITMDPVPMGTRLDPSEAMRYVGRMDIVLGGSPQDNPGIYQLVNPTNHVRPGAPPTLLIQGDYDILVDLETTQALYTKLVQSGVPAISVVFPWTEHMFDLILPQVNPPAQSALYDVDRFLALLANNNGRKGVTI